MCLAEILSLSQRVAAWLALAAAFCLPVRAQPNGTAKVAAAGFTMATTNLICADAPRPVPVVRVLNAISTNPARDWKASELATVAKISYSGLRALFHSAGQGTIHHHIQRARLDQARLLLADKRFSIKDVAGQLNFSSEFYFSHFFRHHTGITPTDFRNHLKG